jgi:recombination protein RecT
MTTSKLTPVKQFSEDVKLCRPSFKKVLPEHITLDKFERTVIGAIQNNPDILQCNRATIFAACQKAAQDGLILDGREAALVQFKGTCQYMPMVGGILKKLRNSGEISTIKAETVHEKDTFSYNPAMEDVPNHKPDWFGDRGPMIGVYAVAKMKDGGTVVEIMNQEQIGKVRNVSRSGSDEKGNPKGIWKQWPEEMARKSVLRRIAKYLPSSADKDQQASVDRMFEHDNENYDLNQDETTPETPPKKNKTRASEIIEAEVIDITEVPEYDGPPPGSTDGSFQDMGDEDPI